MPVGMSWMWTLAFGHHEDRTSAHGCRNARGRDGGVRQELAAGVVLRSGGVCRQSISDSWLGNLRECLAHLVEGSGCDCLLMQAASLLDGFSFDLFPPFENGLTAPEVDVSRRQVVQALVISTVGGANGCAFKNNTHCR